MGQLSTQCESYLLPSLFCLAPEYTFLTTFCLLPIKVLFGHHLWPSCYVLLDHSPVFSFMGLHPDWFVLSQGNGVHSPHQTKGLGRTAVVDHCSLAQPALWDMGCLQWSAAIGVHMSGPLVNSLSRLLLPINLLWSSCYSLVCVCMHCKVAWCFQNTVAIPAWKMACARACFPLVPTDSHCSEQNKTWRMCLGSARTQ